MRHATTLTLCIAITITATSTAADFTVIQRYLDQSASDGVVVGGAVLVIHRGEVVFKSSFGITDLESKQAFAPDTPCVIASISKPVLATAASRLVDQNKLDMTVPITRYLPAFEQAGLESGEPLGRAPTMLELFTHTAGTRHDDAANGRPWLATWTHGQPLSVVVDRYAKEPFKTAPGTRMAYSGIGTDIAARVLEVVAGKPRNELLIEHVCEPLGMTHTYYRDAERIESVKMPTRYYRGKQSGKLFPYRKRKPDPPGAYTSSGGSIISTTEDLGRWLMMIRNGGWHAGRVFLSSESIQRMLTPNRIGPFSHGGFYVRRKDESGKALVIGHTGSTGTNCWLNFEQDTIGIMLTQTRGSDIKPFRIELEKRITNLLASP